MSNSLTCCITSIPYEPTLRCGATLTILICTTWAVAQIDLGRFNTVIALAISFFKASLVVWFFKDLLVERSAAVIEPGSI